MAPPSWIRSAAAIDDEPADDIESNDCGICFSPLISSKAAQCDAGHVICSSCRDMLELPAGRCHVCCGKAACRGSRRGHGRDLWPDYFEPRDRSSVRRGGCRCPGNGCGFVGSTAELLCHFVSAHNWSCTNGVTSGDTITVRLHDGINVVAVDCFSAASSDDDSRRDVAGRYLVMLVVQREMDGRLVSGFCLRPRAAETSFWSLRRNARCHLSLSYSRNVRAAADDETLVQRYDQMTDASVACSDLARGLPDHDRWFQARVIRSDGLEDDEETVEVNLRTIIH